MGVIIGVTGYLIKTPRFDFSEEKQQVVEIPGYTNVKAVVHRHLAMC
jgi:hypothetical protein